MNWETLLLGLIQSAPGLIASIVNALKGSTSQVHNVAVKATGVSIATAGGATPEQAQAAGNLLGSMHAVSVGGNPSTS